MSQNLNISGQKHRFGQPRFFAMGLVVVFLLAAAGLCQAANTPSRPAETLPAQVTDATNTLPGAAGDATRHEWVFVDTTVAGYQDLVDDLSAGANDGRRIEVVLIDSRRDGVEQMAAALAGTSDIDALHLITHGSPAVLQLGTARLTADSMSVEYANALAEIGRALTADGDILVYGCHFGQGDLGRQAAGRLAALTGADIAASDDLTGARALGGDWELEYHSGDVQTAIAFSTQVQQNWSGVLTWWDTNWLNRIKITFDNRASDDEDLLNFPVLVRLIDPDNIDFGKILDGGDDIRFVDANNNTLLDYEIEDWDDPGKTATVWVRVPQIDNNDDTDYIYIYYNNSDADDAQDAEGVWYIDGSNNGYEGVWHLDETGTGTRYDSTSNTHHGTPVNYDNDEATTGMIDGADEFDGDDPADYINVSSINPGSYDDFTISAWYKSRETTTNDDQYIFNHLEVYDYGSGWNFSLTDDSGGPIVPDSMRLVIYNNDNPPLERYYRVYEDLVDQQYHHLAAVRGDGKIKLYVDGVETNVHDDLDSGQTISVDAGAGPYIGDFPGATEQVDGILDEVRLSSTARSADWIEACYLSPPPRCQSC